MLGINKRVKAGAGTGSNLYHRLCRTVLMHCLFGASGIKIHHRPQLAGLPVKSCELGMSLELRLDLSVGTDLVMLAV